ncbi:MAG TPA: hypothetical protein VFZ99_06860 [Terriglobales bacterium]
MKNTFGFVGLLMAVAIGAYIYSRQVTSLSPAGAAGNPRATVDVVGVQNDLNAIASAERRRLAADGKYASLDDLISNGDISMRSKKHGPYEYSSDISDNGFRITASYAGDAPPQGVPQSFSIDETMQIKQQ